MARALRIRSSLAVLHLENASLSGRPLVLLGELGSPIPRRPRSLLPGWATQEQPSQLPPTHPQPQH